MDIDFNRLFANIDDSTTLDMDSQSLDGLEIRSGNDNLHYFYDTINRRLVTEFRIATQTRVATYCAITLVARGEKYSPRVRLWKRDLSKRAIADWEAGETRGAHIVKAQVDVGVGHSNFLKLMDYVISLAETDVSSSAVRVIDASDAELAASLRGRSRADLLPIIESALDSPLTSSEIATLGGRKAHLEKFERFLMEDGYIEDVAKNTNKKIEAIWQEFFEGAPWIFGYGLTLVSHLGMDEGKLERITVGNNIWTGGGSRSDAVMRSKAQISTLLFCEIKRHDTALLHSRPYREPDVYAPSAELSGGTAQLQKTVRKSIRLLKDQIEEHTASDGTPTGLEFSTTKPRQVLVIGNLNEFRTPHGTNGEKVESFELYRKTHTDVEIITFDELYQRARYIIDS